MSRRKRCGECRELVPADELKRIKDEAYDADHDEMVEIVMDLCRDCIDDMNEPAYGTYGDREDQISFDSAMFRN